MTLNLSNLSAQIYECLLLYPETRVGGKVFFQKFMEVYYPNADFNNLPFDIQSVGRIQRAKQKEDRDNLENKIQPPKETQAEHKKLEEESRIIYTPSGQGTMFAPSSIQYEN